MEVKNDVANYYISPLDDTIPTCFSDDTLGAVLAKSKNSHEGIFVYDKDGTFHGMVSPYNALFHKRLPYLSRIKTCIFHPPYIIEDTPLYKVAELMVSMQLYTLPVFNTRSVIKADDILKKLIKQPDLLNRVSKYLIIHKPIVMPIGGYVREAYKIMKTKNISRIVVVDEEGDCAGIISRHDVQDVFRSKPPRERFGRREENLKYHSFFNQEKITRLDSPITMFLTKAVLTINHNNSIVSIIKKMVKVGTSSIVLVDGFKPVGFLSRHDVLKGISQLKQEKNIPIIWTDEKKALDAFTQGAAYEVIEKFLAHFNRYNQAKQANVNIDAIYNRASKVKLYYIKLHIALKNGHVFIAESESRNVIDGLHDVIKKIHHESDRSDRQKHERYYKYY